mmetsp:Transcript_14607/g.61691  ORF Transcript_14607/g.61691 Transcript_14607/m.61691 type:complete len:214 (+) Transcript_14607:586-1227(+)
MRRRARRSSPDARRRQIRDGGQEGGVEAKDGLRAGRRRGVGRRVRRLDRTRGDDRERRGNDRRVRVFRERRSEDGGGVRVFGKRSRRRSRGRSSRRGGAADVGDEPCRRGIWSPMWHQIRRGIDQIRRGVDQIRRDAFARRAVRPAAGTDAPSVPRAIAATFERVGPGRTQSVRSLAARAFADPGAREDGGDRRARGRPRGDGRGGGDRGAAR